jgi:DNA polymerase III subunit epsilon
MPAVEHRQGSLDDLGAPLVDTTFVVVDLETTGGDPKGDAITEVGAVRLRGGRRLGTFATLVNPGRAIPPTISVLTGITESMVARAPRIEAVLPSLLEFIGDGVVVGHNVRFDVGFLQAALARDGRPALANRTVDTVPLARRLLADEVPNCRLGTLAERLRLPHRPTHRALDDAMATGDLLHVLLDRAGSMGVTGLDDLLSLPAMAGHPQAAKLALTTRLPRSPGVYLFRDGRGGVLYVGKATDLRSRVRSYFSTDERRKVGALLRETERIDHKRCPSTLEAAVLEARLIRALTPRYNAQGTRWQRYPYVRLTLSERWPRLSVVRTVRSGDLHLGPLPSTSVANSVVEAIETVVPLRRCRGPVPSRPNRSAPCASAQLGVSACPCAGGVDEGWYRAEVQRVVAALQGRPEALVEPLVERMEAMARAERFEEAAATRVRLAALSTALRRQRRIDALLRCPRVELRLDSGEVAELRHGILWHMKRPDELVERAVEMRPDVLPTPDEPPDRAQVDELMCVGAWLDRHAARVRVELVEGELASPFPAVPRFEPRRVPVRAAAR